MGGEASGVTSRTSKVPSRTSQPRLSIHQQLSAVRPWPPPRHVVVHQTEPRTQSAASSNPPAQPAQPSNTSASTKQKVLVSLLDLACNSPAAVSSATTNACAAPVSQGTSEIPSGLPVTLLTSIHQLMQGDRMCEKTRRDLTQRLRAMGIRTPEREEHTTRRSSTPTQQTEDASSVPPSRDRTSPPVVVPPPPSSPRESSKSEETSGRKRKNEEVDSPSSSILLARPSHDYGSRNVKPRNRGKCGRCRRPGNLICCDGCPAAFHKACLPAIAYSMDEQGDWFCPACVKKRHGEKGGRDGEEDENENENEEDEDEDEDDEDDECVFEIEDLVDKRVVLRDGKEVVEYLVKWAGYDDSESTWESEIHSELKAKFERRR